MKRGLLATTCLLSLAASAAAAEPAVRSVRFTATPAPVSEQDMTVPTTASAALVTYADGTTRSFPLSYTALLRSGETVGGVDAGLIVDRSGKAIAQSLPTDKGEIARGPFHAYAPDANSLIVTAAGPRLITHFEYHTEAPNLVEGKPPVQMYGQLPMVMTMTALSQDPATGRLAAQSVSPVDMAGIGGLWIPCAGTLTPWNTHLGSEEYEPDARTYESKPLQAMNLYLGTAGRTAAEGGAKPYDYGHLVEVAIKDGTAVASKHYATGRLSFELADIQEDGRTAYYGDDGRDVARFMFVADRANDLSAGTLYAARWQQTDGTGGGKATLHWIRLGHASNAEIKALVDQGIRFSDMFDTAEAPTEGFTPVYVYPGTGAKPRLEFLKLKPGREQAAAFLESRRMAALLGATTEFTKMEGQTHDATGRKLYTAMAYVEKGMLDGKNEERPRDDIRLSGDEKDLVCGVVYESALAGGQKDQNGDAIASDWVAVDMTAVIVGARRPEGRGNRYDRCDTDRVANADNIKFSPALRTLFVGEDSGNHINNFLWAYQVDERSLTRLASAPIGAEWTGLAVVEALNGHGYILSNIQHPGAAEDLEKYPDEIRLEMRRKVDQRGVVGVLGGLPGVDATSKR